MMKRIITYLVVCSVLVICIPSGSEARRPLDSQQINRRYHTYRRMKATGISLTLSGVAAQVGGWAMFYWAQNQRLYTYPTSCYSCRSRYDMLGGVGMLTATMGVVAFMAGVPLWIVGSIKKRKYGSMRTWALTPTGSYDPFTRTVHFGLQLDI